MEDQGEKNRITYDMVDIMYRNITNMGISETSSERSPNQQFLSTCYSIFVNHHNSNFNFNRICITLLSYFQLFKVTSSSSNPDSYCGYANYWLNGKLREENGKSDTDTSIFFEIFNGSLNKYSGSSECKKYIYNLGDETFKKMNIDILMKQLLSLSMCADQQDIILSIDKKMAESTSQNQREESSQAITISASSFGTMMGISPLSLFLYKVTPLSFWLSPRIGNLKKTLNIIDNEEQESLFHYS
ncbi:PIR Superfamily Protein [Plasmodium ovale curtisi]|uniref:PIR Superfamily Protein n=1 Tax=Plasmodium ovale curtisi TaxID=864141 RepID=A0A1A8WR16_PLAOA|nr:PIR Superfamily Protein [Plasmodium ovale curtisi]